MHSRNFFCQKGHSFFKSFLGEEEGVTSHPVTLLESTTDFVIKEASLARTCFFNRSVLVKNASYSIQVIIWDTTLNIRSTGCQCRYSRSKPQYKVPFFQTFFKTLWQPSYESWRDLFKNIVVPEVIMSIPKYQINPCWFIRVFATCSLTHSLSIYPLSTLWKHQTTLRFSDVFKEREGRHWERSG